MAESEVDQFTMSEFPKWLRSYFVENPSDPNEVAWSLSYGAAISVTRDPSTRKLWIRPDGVGFEPHNEVRDFISAQLFRNYNHPWAKWTDIPSTTRDAWFDEFLRQHMTLPEHRAASSGNLSEAVAGERVAAWV
ncbi:hypothetical protein K1719_043834 [Acacia pycnantha]|nr:hypothetical protein K1719_043834 [Acacia pycnantha]